MFETIFIILVLLISVMVHEVSHGYMAYFLGDPTAKYENRLNFNPLNHIDPFGSVILPLSLVLLTKGSMWFGWAKPVPFNPYNLRDQKYGPAKVALAGPTSNLLIAVFFGIIIRLFHIFPMLGIDVPIYLLSFFNTFSYLFSFIVWINLTLMVFNLVPIPPLDGHHILFALLPESASEIKRFLLQYQYPLLFVFIFFLSGGIIFPAVSFLFQQITGMYFFG